MFYWSWHNMVWGLAFMALAILSFVALLVGPDKEQVTWRPVELLIRGESQQSENLDPSVWDPPK